MTRDDLRSLVGDLVRIETENPPGNEAACSEYIVEWFESRGIDATRVETPSPDRPQVAVRVGAGDPTVVLNGHVDVVPAGDPERWRHPPYEGVVEGDRLYGRGAVDMKAGVACGMCAVADLHDELVAGDLDGTLVFHAAIGEETAEPGTKALLDAGFDGDYGVVLEPTRCRTATSEKGLAWYEITVSGEPGHASRPDRGTNAIQGARRVLDALDAYDAEVRERRDDLVGRGYATVTRFDAGTKANVVPESAVLTVDRRFLPSESVEQVDSEIDGLCATVAADHDVDVSWERTRVYESAAIPTDHELAAVFRRHSTALADAPTEPWGIPASTDVRNFVNDAGMAAITWGPGDGKQCHTIDEYVDLDLVETGAEILERAVRDLLRR